MTNNSQLHDLRSRRSSLRQSGTVSSFVSRFCARRAQNRDTDTMESTMLPQARKRLNAAPRNSWQLQSEPLRSTAAPMARRLPRLGSGAEGATQDRMFIITSGQLRIEKSAFCERP